ncbi:hypothetical protein A499_09899 [Niallia nealsonii AAU1]|nr:hypothetical protein A499_09899 [Niallia nealsonii AAU1]
MAETKILGPFEPDLVHTSVGKWSRHRIVVLFYSYISHSIFGVAFLHIKVAPCFPFHEKILMVGHKDQRRRKSNEFFTRIT